MQESVENIEKNNNAIQGAEAELRYLRETIEVLRSELERHRFDQEVAVQKVEANTHTGTRNLSETISESC